MSVSALSAAYQRNPFGIPKQDRSRIAKILGSHLAAAFRRNYRGSNATMPSSAQTTESGSTGKEGADKPPGEVLLTEGP